METYKHFGHRHILTRYGLTRDVIIHYGGNNGPLSRASCKGCGLSVSNDFYGCERCEYWVCRSCFKLPREMPHPFHREHPLTLLLESPYETGDASCNVCSKRCEGFIYHCSECKFDLDVHCATLMPTTSKEEKEKKKLPLIPCVRNNKDVDFSCSVCLLPIPIKATIYVCLDSRVIVDESCAQLPHQITHPFHPHHSLTLQNAHNYCSYPLCKACQDFKGSNLYHCSECEFSLDVRCASLIPKAIVEPEPEPEPFTHPHHLIPCETKGNFRFRCSACESSIQEGTIYVCLECRLLLHKSCAQLPRFIKHPFHPAHPLMLRELIVLTYPRVLQDKDIRYSCQACKRTGLGFNYWCGGTCDFAIHVTCASTSYSTFKFDQLHHHSLAFFNNKNQANANLCNVCQRFTSFPSFRCVPCDFTLNFCCHPTLPPTFKHSCHDRHPLNLTRSPIKDNPDDDEDSEYYCDLCEERRVLGYPTYYCQECHYVAHLSCVFDEILSSLERERSLPQDEEIIMLQAEVDALTTELETVTTKLDERAQHFSDYKVGVIEAEIKNASTDKKALLSATDDPAIAKADEEIIMLQAEADALTTKLEMVTPKLDALKEIREQHIGSYQVGTKFSLTALDNTNGEVEEDCNVESMKKEEKDHESDGTFTTLVELDKEIEAVKTKLETLEKKRAPFLRS